MSLYLTRASRKEKNTTSIRTIQHSIKHYNPRRPMSSQPGAISVVSFLSAIRQRCSTHTDNLYKFIETYCTCGFVDVPKTTKIYRSITSVAAIIRNKVYAEQIERCWINLMWRIGEICARILTCWEFGVLDPEMSELEAVLGLVFQCATPKVAKGDESLMLYSNATLP